MPAATARPAYASKYFIMVFLLTLTGSRNFSPLLRSFALYCALCCVLACSAASAKAQSSPTTAAASATVCPAGQTPAELVRSAIQNQIKADQQPRLFAWKERKHKGQQTQVQTIVETPDGALSRVTLIDEKPLTPKQRAEEDERLRHMSDPEQMKHRLKSRQEDDERTRALLSAIPDAFDFTVDGDSLGPNGHNLVRIRFSARPGFDPPSRETAVFTGMQGTMVVDQTACRLASIDGTLFKDVNFGWGILGRLYKGGRFLVEQSEVSPSQWETTHTVVKMEGKALLLKPIHIDENESDWDFQPVPPMSVAQAMDFLSRSQSQQSTMRAP